MSEEEKEAIKYLEFLINEKCECEACQRAKKEYKTILNLIDKQQREIEEWRNGIRINDNVTIPKDKIRAKIQIYKDKKADSVGMLINYEYWKTKIEVLQELLEEK